MYKIEDIINKIHQADCLEFMKEIPDNSVDSIVTDPPYGLSFMGKSWDYDVPKVEIWKECLRVLKPGGHLLAFAGTRTQHRMAVNIEDAGFEIRDMIAWVYSTGFPKSLNIYKQLQKNCNCGNMEVYDNERTKEISKHNLRPLQQADLSKTKPFDKEHWEVLQSSLQEQSVYPQGEEAVAVLQFPEGAEQSSMEGGANLQATKGELQRSNLSEMPARVFTDGEKGRIHNATQTGDGSTLETTTDENGSSASHRPQSEQQQDREPCAFCKQWGTQKVRETAGKGYGWGTALKPALEPITVARKHISEKNIAENVLKWGTGGINIDESRVVATQEYLDGKGNAIQKKQGDIYGFANYEKLHTRAEPNINGRFPANFIHDGSEEVLELFPNSKGGAFPKSHGSSGFVSPEEKEKRIEMNDSGSASRFFYCAKSSKSERNDGLEGAEFVRHADREKDDDVGGDNPRNRSNTLKQNFHPTVKPIKLMEYLVTLVTPKNGIVLDPFMGSGSTGVACKNKGFNFIGIELDQGYCKMAEARINAQQEQQTLI